MLNNELFIEHALKKPVLGLHPYQNGVDDSPQFGKALLDGLGVAPVHGLLRVLFQPRLHLLPKGRVSCETSFESNGEMDVIMGVYDDQFQQLGWTWGIINPEGNDEGFGMCFGEQGEIYMLGWMDIRTSSKPENIYVGFMDEDLNKLSEIYYRPDDYYLGPLDIAAIPTGGCVVCCNRVERRTEQADYCIYKIMPEDFLNIEEAHSHGFAVATVYPNPGKDVFSIRTVLQNARVEVYDLNGRLIHGQALTEHVTAIDATDWVEGVYVWKVYAGDPSTGSKSRVETGKWIKE